jgi:hypothetical protein
MHAPPRTLCSDYEHRRHYDNGTILVNEGVSITAFPANVAAAVPMRLVRGGYRVGRTTITAAAARRPASSSK